MAGPLSPDPLRMAIVAAARRWIGTPYRHQAARRGVGCDCLGLVAGVWADVYGAMPDYDRSYSADWAESAGAGEPLLGACKARCSAVFVGDEQAGDLLVFRWSPHVAAKHLAIMAAPAMMIHARERHAVCETALTHWWKRRLAAVFAFPFHGDFSAAR
ncbi:MAG: C40 family peptidase [Roseitalea sp.]|jgi:NlpC/P60 family putative phage cell wall peptidase|uniref:Peptidase P60 n=1 Tax=Oceaniradius stylonematis TaxID=2184161 RepID=A0A3A8A9X2_9HYPH|nr:C40 family peptidase [Roseitalea sp.]MBO6953649.1 C40 family peptidase [Rhizobiaceae bacterium]RKF06695.1 peptidase P60 [Oceaniradius stylonematis]RNC93553.1 MAG: peptidase P60 [Oricola sp.]MBO6593922.1 C40 family peptidase [Roseitalea sp.]